MYARFVTIVAVFVSSLAAGAVGIDAAQSQPPSWQAGVENAVRLTVRNTNGSRYVADFSVTDPHGMTRHAQVTSSDGVAQVILDSDPENRVFLPLADAFEWNIPGKWIWICRVAGKSVAHGSFTYSRVEKGPYHQPVSETLRVDEVHF